MQGPETACKEDHNSAMLTFHIDALVVELVDTQP